MSTSDNEDFPTFEGTEVCEKQTESKKSWNPRTQTQGPPSASNSTMVPLAPSSAAARPSSIISTPLKRTAHQAIEGSKRYLSYVRKYLRLF
jgi:hypothetical protein